MRVKFTRIDVLPSIVIEAGPFVQIEDRKLADDTRVLEGTALVSFPANPQNPPPPPIEEVVELARLNALNLGWSPFDQPGVWDVRYE